jgi:hypothetical protein
LLAAGVAHEVNTPLTGVSSYTQMLLGMLNENDPKHALLQKVRTQAERATNIVNNLLNFSRTGSATEFAEVDVARVLDDTLQLLEPQLRRSQIEIVRITTRRARSLTATPASCSRSLRTSFSTRAMRFRWRTNHVSTEHCRRWFARREIADTASASRPRTSRRFTIRSTPQRRRPGNRPRPRRVVRHRSGTYRTHQRR